MTGNRKRRDEEGWPRRPFQDPNSALKPGRFRLSSLAAFRRTRKLGTEASHAAVDAVTSAIRATDEITGEATGFVRDAVIGVMEGTEQVAKIGRPVVRDVVAAAVRSSTEMGGSIPEVSQRAVEGAIVGAASIGVDSDAVGAQASAGVVEAVRELGGDFRDIVAPAIHGVVIGVLTTSGDLFEATRDTAVSLLTSGAQSGEDVAEVARIIVGEAIKASRIHAVGSTDAVMGAAQGCVEAAYAQGPELGDTVRFTVMAVVDAPISALAPTIRHSLNHAVADLSEELRDRPQAWRGVALWRALKTVIGSNGFDIGAALAYYLLLALFPLVALVIVGLSAFIDAAVIRRTVTEVVVFYFPSSKEFLGQAIDHLFTARLAASLIALGAMLFGAQGLFMAANRGVNRVFDCPPRRVLGVTVSTFATVIIAVVLFLFSVGLTVAFQLALGVIEDLPRIGGPLNDLLVLMGRVGSVLAPFLIAAMVFVIVYKYLPNRYVGWSNATFGAIVTVILFELAKYGFFWFANLASQRSILYGSLSSVILLLVWSHVAGMIFLYGAAITKEASDLRPQVPFSLRKRAIAADSAAEEKRQADMALGRSRRRDRPSGW